MSTSTTPTPAPTTAAPRHQQVHRHDGALDADATDADVIALHLHEAHCPGTGATPCDGPGQDDHVRADVLTKALSDRGYEIHEHGHVCAADEPVVVSWEVAAGLVLVCALAVGYLPHRVQIAGTVVYLLLAVVYVVWRIAGGRYAREG